MATMNKPSLSLGGLNKPAAGLSTGAAKPGLSLGGGLGGLGGLGGSAKPLAKVDIPAELQNKTVKSCLETFEAQLEQQSKQFLLQARQIARWDRSLYECLSLLQHLEQQIKTVEGAQKELAQSATSLLQEQETFISTLEDKKTEELPDSTDQRQRLYRLAHDLGENFLEMEAQLKSLVEQTEGVAQSEAASDVAKIEQISNCHLDAMKWIESQSADLEKKLQSIEKKLPASI